jgi:Zn-dependent protease
MYDEYGSVYVPPGYGKIRFSRKEALHIIVSVAALTFAFFMTFVYGRQLSQDRMLYYLAASALAVLTGFLLHELAHKFVAQRYGAWAEFRAYPTGLLFAMFFAFIAGIVFAAPGAVYIQGRITERQNGLISLAGPATNLAFGAFCIGLMLVFRSDLLFIVGWINLFLAVFNLVPVGPLDGAKVFRWNKIAYAGVMGAATAMLVLTYIGFLG